MKTKTGTMTSQTNTKMRTMTNVVEVAKDADAGLKGPDAQADVVLQA